MIDVLEGQFSVNRQRENFFHHGFGLRELRQIWIKFGDRRLLVIRHRIMDTGADSFALQVLCQFIASLSADDVHVVNGISPFFLRRRLHDTTKTFGVTSCNVSPMLI